MPARHALVRRDPSHRTRPRRTSSGAGVRAWTLFAAAVLVSGPIAGGGAALAEPGAGDRPAVEQGDRADRADQGEDEDRGGQQDGGDEPNPNCTLVVPPAPLTAAGLATPYRLKATDRDGGACHESNRKQSAFVEATILDPATGALSTYRPLVVDDDTDPAAPVVVPALPAGAVVGVWFGFQGDVLTLRGDGDGGKADASCVNGLRRSPFGQFGHCGAPAFFTAANAAIAAGKLAVPPLGTANDGLPCPSTRDFAVVDQDQSDNVTTTYLVRDGRTAQDTPANAAQPDTKRLTNASDNGLLVRGIDPALGCRPFTAPDLTAGGAPSTSLALDELQAAAHQAAPVALIPPTDPMAREGDDPSREKTNLYRAGVDMPPLDGEGDGEKAGKAYCRDLASVAARRLERDRDAFRDAPSPDPKVAKNLFRFLTQRLTASWQELNCRDLTGDDAPRVADDDD